MVYQTATKYNIDGILHNNDNVDSDINNAFSITD